MKTAQEIIEKLKGNKIDVVGPLDKDEILEALKELDASEKVFSDKESALIRHESGFKMAYCSLKGNPIFNFMIYIIDPKGKIKAIISEIELVEPFFFQNIVIAPGTDAITCYDFISGENKTSYIR